MNMRTSVMVLGLALTLALANVPAFAAVEGSDSAPAGELTLAHFMRTAGKPVQAWEQYRQYKYRLAHPAPQSTLDASRMRSEAGEKTLADFQRSAGKPIQALEQYRQYKERKAHPSPRKPYIAPSFTSSGKPSMDWWKARQLRKG